MTIALLIAAVFAGIALIRIKTYKPTEFERRLKEVHIRHFENNDVY